MISKQQAKFVKSLKLKKYRKNAASFIVEGAKNIAELLNSDFEISHLFLTQKFVDEYKAMLIQVPDYTVCMEKELVSIGTFQSNEYGLAVAKMKVGEVDVSNENMLLALDNVSDPGNLGTIVRIADWYGIRHILASMETADFYNPKVIHASMGSFTRVQVHFMDLGGFLSQNTTHKVYGAMLNGDDVHKTKLETPAVILMGNESNGINEGLIQFLDKKVTIPKLGGAESLNVAVSTAIICDNFFRS